MMRNWLKNGAGEGELMSPAIRQAANLLLLPVPHRGVGFLSWRWSDKCSRIHGRSAQCSPRKPVLKSEPGMAVPGGSVRRTKYQLSDCCLQMGFGDDEQAGALVLAMKDDPCHHNRP